MRPYRLQLLQALKSSDLELRASSYADLLGIMEEDGFPDKLVFSDEATFHISGKVNLRI
jgi:rRNA maturation protein Rpf1